MGINRGCHTIWVYRNHEKIDEIDLPIFTEENFEDYANHSYYVQAVNKEEYEVIRNGENIAKITELSYVDKDIKM